MRYWIVLLVAGEKEKGKCGFAGVFWAWKRTLRVPAGRGLGRCSRMPPAGIDMHMPSEGQQSCTSVLASWDFGLSLGTVFRPSPEHYLNLNLIRVVFS